jgi:hypothetical protein
MAEAKTDLTRNDDAALKASSNWLSIIKDIFPQLHDHFGSTEAVKAKLRALFDDPETRLRIRRVDANGEEVPNTRRSVGVKFCQDHLWVAADPDSGDDHIAVDYSDPYVDYYTPGGHWELEVRRRDVKRLHPELAPPPAPTTVGAETRAIAHLKPLLQSHGDAMSKDKVRNACEQFKLSGAGFDDRVWPAAREAAGLSREAPAGRKRRTPTETEIGPEKSGS